MKKTRVKNSCDTVPLIQDFIWTTNRDYIGVHTEFDIMSHSAFIIFDITYIHSTFFTIQHYVPFGVHYIQHYFPSTFFTNWHYVVFGIFYLRSYVLSSFCPIQCFVLSNSLPFDVCSVDVLSVNVFNHRRFLLWHFVGEPFRALYSGKSLIWAPESWDPQEARTFSDSQYSYPRSPNQNGMRSASTFFSQAQWKSVRVSKERGLKRSIPCSWPK